MMYFILMGVALLAAAVIPFVITDNEGQRYWGSYVPSGVILGLVVVSNILASFQQIPVGHVGIVYRFGDIVSQRDSGLTLVPPWESVSYANIRVQRFEKRLASFTKTNSQEIHIDVDLQYYVGKDRIQGLYREVGENYRDILLASRLEQVFKDETIRYETLEVAPNREKLRHDVAKRLEKELARFSIVVVDLFVKDIDFGKKYQEAISRTQVAAQEALAEMEKVKKAEYEAQQKVKAAEGEGQAILVMAQKQAQANKVLAESLTPNLVQYQAVQKLSDKITVMMVPSGANMIMPPEAFAAKK